LGDDFGLELIIYDLKAHKWKKAKKKTKTSDDF